jgi:hypothetical protein
MKIQITLAEAQRILCDKLGATLLNNTGIDACVTVEITVPVPVPVPVPNGNGYFHKIRAIKALRDDYTARNDHIGLAEAKRQVELVYDTGCAKAMA